ncbi:MAG: damage-inducible protein DinB [Acidobacteria bacterium]|nr:damage-inducible protein DinB [Acidobacteriota bacterium]
MSTPSVIAEEFLRELEAEAGATRKCLEQVPMDKPEYKPHEKSMELGYLALLVADIPKWIHVIIDKGEIDFATYEHSSVKTVDELVAHFDEVMEKARTSLKGFSEDMHDQPFDLKNSGQLLYSTTKRESVSESINHMVHHRGQLSVYLRLNDKPVPSIYGPSADDRSF